MFKKSLILVLAAFFLGGCSLGTKKSGLEIISFPVAKVYINGKEMGMTPYKNMGLKPGENEIRLKTNNREWKRRVDLQNNVSTIIDWQFGDDSDGDSGYILYLEKTGEKKASLLVNTEPDKATIKVDDQNKGLSPKKVGGIDIGDRKLTISFPGRKDLTVFMKAIESYQLIVNVKLAKEKIDIQQLINKESELTNTLTATGKAIIKETETGWLRVREQNNNFSKEVTKVKPGESYNILEEKSEWIKIDLGSSKSGWVSASYVEKS